MLESNLQKRVFGHRHHWRTCFSDSLECIHCSSWNFFPTLKISPFTKEKKSVRLSTFEAISSQSTHALLNCRDTACKFVEKIANHWLEKNGALNTSFAAYIGSNLLSSVGDNRWPPRNRLSSKRPVLVVRTDSFENRFIEVKAKCIPPSSTKIQGHRSYCLLTDFFCCCRYFATVFHIRIRFKLLARHP